MSQYGQEHSSCPHSFRRFGPQASELSPIVPWKKIYTLLEFLPHHMLLIIILAIEVVLIKLLTLGCG